MAQLYKDWPPGGLPWLTADVCTDPLPNFPNADSIPGCGGGARMASHPEGVSADVRWSRILPEGVSGVMTVSAFTPRRVERLKL
jgi:hypothetical protein